MGKITGDYRLTAYLTFSKFSRQPVYAAISGTNPAVF
jgi:hypothetical protein